WVLVVAGLTDTTAAPADGVVAAGWLSDRVTTACAAAGHTGVGSACAETGALGAAGLTRARAGTRDWFPVCGAAGLATAALAGKAPAALIDIAVSAMTSGGTMDLASLTTGASQRTVNTDAGPSAPP